MWTFAVRSVRLAQLRCVPCDAYRLHAAVLHRLVSNALKRFALRVSAPPIGGGRGGVCARCDDAARRAYSRKAPHDELLRCLVQVSAIGRDERCDRG